MGLELLHPQSLGQADYDQLRGLTATAAERRRLAIKGIRNDRQPFAVGAAWPIRRFGLATIPKVARCPIVPLSLHTVPGLTSTNRQSMFV
jgi:hypothetical protein